MWGNTINADEATQTKIAQLLQLAQQAMLAKHLTIPESGSAYEYYQKVLTLAPNHQQAQAGLDNIVKQYIRWAKYNATQFNWKKAQHYLDLAASISPHMPILKRAQQALIEQRLLWIEATIKPQEEKKPINTEGRIFRDVFRLNSKGYGPDMVIVPAGRFYMGDLQGVGQRDEGPVHEVNIEAFAIARYEVTIGEYTKFLQYTNYQPSITHINEIPNYPITHVTWFDTQAYVQWLSEETGKNYRLPTEAEWEYAARGGAETNYWWGNTMMSKHAVCRNCDYQRQFTQALPVGHFVANRYGLFDVAGNVAEWTGSVYQKPYAGAELYLINLKPPNLFQSLFNNDWCVVRGGAWNQNAAQARASARQKRRPTWRGRNTGFRVARDL